MSRVEIKISCGDCVHPIRCNSSSRCVLRKPLIDLKPKPKKPTTKKKKTTKAK